MKRTLLTSFSKFMRNSNHNSLLIMKTKKTCDNAKEIFHAAVKSVQPDNLINKSIQVNSNFVQIQGRNFIVEKNVYVVGFGKAVLGMVRELENKLNEHIISGIVSVPEGIVSSVNGKQKNNSKIQVFEGALNNIPDEKSYFAAKKISDLVLSLKESDLLFVLISGGGSALLPSPKSPVTLEEKCKVIKLLASKGALIEELNTVRKRLSTLKGGGFAQLAKPAKVVSLILSDIVGDPLGLIASGPTVKNTDDLQLPLSIIKKYNIESEVPKNVLCLLQNVQPNNSSFSHVTNFVIGSNQIALEAAASMALTLNYHPCILTNALIGKAADIGMKLISLIKAALEYKKQLVYSIGDKIGVSEASLNNLLNCIQKLESENQKLCLLFGGETTVEVHGTGTGGRNQELALKVAIELSEKHLDKSITLLSAGTDGIDGPTDAAGALAAASVIDLSKSENLNAKDYLDNNDSYTFYSKLCNGQYHIKTGHTGTNVMDVIIILIEK